MLELSYLQSTIEINELNEIIQTLPLIMTNALYNQQVCGETLGLCIQPLNSLKWFTEIRVWNIF